MRKKWIIPVVLIIAVLGIASFWFVSGPKRVAQEWLKCENDKSLVSRSDQEYWDESQYMRDDPFYKACLGTVTIGKVDFSGLTAIVKYRYRYPDLSDKQFSEFPALATSDEKVRLIRERAANSTKFVEATSQVNLMFEGLNWAVQLGLKDRVLLRREEKKADDFRHKKEFKSAVEVFDSILQKMPLNEAEVTYAKNQRKGVLSEYACILAAKKYLKYPESTDYNLNGYGDGSVYGDIMVSNSFGVKSKVNTSCNVTFASDKSTASVKLSMINLNDIESINISEDAVSVSIAF